MHCHRLVAFVEIHEKLSCVTEDEYPNHFASLLKFANFFIRLYENLKDTTNILFGHRIPFVAESIKGKSFDFGEKGNFDWATSNSNKVVLLI